MASTLAEAVRFHMCPAATVVRGRPRDLPKVVSDEAIALAYNVTLAELCRLP